MTEKDLKHLEQIVDSDHEMIELLKKEISTLNTDLQESKQSYRESAEALALHEKVSAQQTLLKHVFSGVIGLVLCMWSLVFVGWFTGQQRIEREMAFFERIILVFIGIVGGAVSSFFDVRNFALSSVKSPNGNGYSNGNGNGKPKDTD